MTQQRLVNSLTVPHGILQRGSLLLLEDAVLMVVALEKSSLAPKRVVITCLFTEGDIDVVTDAWFYRNSDDVLEVVAPA